ncbi:MAG TPA: PIN domain-containing protein [Bacilli bacterium]|nr:PIN domain-containing protein [Bacilli bacterium]
MGLPTAWIDTNIIVRFLTNDHPEMSRECQALMQRADEGLVRLKVPVMVIAECCWVLKRIYRFSDAIIADTLRDLIMADGIEMEEKEIVFEALYQFGKHNVGFIDAYLAESARVKQPGYILTFNEKDFTRLRIANDRPRDMQQTLTEIQ